MCKKSIYLTLFFTFAFSSMAMASDIAFYVGTPNVDGWYDVATMTADVATIIAETGHLFKDIQQFDDDQFDDFGAWVDERTDDGEMDILWLNGCMPSVLYPYVNLEPDGSRAELWLDGGNMIINVGDWFGYVSYETGVREAPNANAGANNILDLSEPIAGGQQGVMTVTAAGTEYLPSLNAINVDRPVVLSAIVDPWEVAEIFGQNSDETHADPVVLHNLDTEGYIAFINQAGSGNWIDDRGLTCAEFIGNWVTEQGLLGAGNPIARGPDPKDGAMLTAAWYFLAWEPGNFAVSHDVYLGDNFDDVNDGTGDTFRGNQTSTDLFIGFIGNPYPDGLVPGTTYYWRIDEVNDTDPNSPWKGPIWSFWIQPRIAYEPVPADGAKFIDPNAAVLSWSAGLGAEVHFVYFGDNFDDVNSAVEGSLNPTTTYALDTLEPDKTYYWRVDESADIITKLKGDVWSFATDGPGEGVKGQYYHHDGATPHDPASLAFSTLVLTRTDPQINFLWGDFSPDPSINVDDFSVIWTGEVEVVFTETYTFYTNTDDGVKLWVDDQLIIDNWTDHAPTEDRGTIDLVGGQTYPIEMWFYERGGGATAELRWSSPRTPKQLVPQGALSPKVRASGANPSNGATDVKLTATLSWKPGEAAASHEVYLGTDEDAVRNADTTSPEYKATKNLGSESYDPPGNLAWLTTYYWRVDEVNNVNPDSPWVGNIWSFTTAEFILVEDFEDYNDFEPYRIFDIWLDGWGVDENGSEIGYADPNFNLGEHHVETTIVHGGSQSAPYFYDINFKYSEATYSPAQRDWTEGGVEVLSLWFYGDAANAAAPMYFALNSGTAVYNDNANASQIEEWTEWTIDLQAFTGVGLTNVNKIAIGFGDKNNLQAGGTGLVFFDDIRLYRPSP